MRPVTGTSKLQMKFELMRQTKTHPRFVAVHGRGLGSWISPTNPTLGQRAADVWIVNHPVVDLSAPATYKYRVTFKWLDAQGQTLSTQAQTSPTCYQPELRADLLVKSLSMTPITTGPNAGKTAYTAVIAQPRPERGGPGRGRLLRRHERAADGDARVRRVQVHGSPAVRGGAVHAREHADRDRRSDAEHRRVRLREQRADDDLPGGVVRLTKRPGAPIYEGGPELQAGR